MAYSSQGNHTAPINYIKFQCGFLTEETPFLMVMRASQVVDVSITPGDKTSGFLTPIVGIEGGIHLDFDRKKELLFWVEGKDDDEENVRKLLIKFNILLITMRQQIEIL